MRVVVTGCAGFIGSHLSEKLINLGHDLLGIDSMVKDSNFKIRLSNLSFLKNLKGFEFLQEDIRNHIIH